jgi:hypothetical protein
MSFEQLQQNKNNSNNKNNISSWIATPTKRLAMTTQQQPKGKRHT